MKRFFLSLIGVVVTSMCFAQDIIVQKDGGTIQAKVIKVTQSEVEYKKFNNQNGPTYTISTKDLQCINYENGTKDTFVSPNYNPNIVTNETATQYSNDQKLLAMYNNSKSTPHKAKALKITGWVAGGTVMAVGVIMLGMGAAQTASYNNGDAELDGDPLTFSGVGLLGVGAVTWAGCYFRGRAIEKKSRFSVQSSPIYQHEFNLGKNDRLMVGIDMLQDNTRRNQTLGLGLSYNF